jgi:hydrogenase/urease accessory protein HupE
MIRPSPWHVRILLAALFFILSAGHGAAHSMKQVRSEFAVDGDKWRASVWLEAWALYPEDGPKVPPGPPGDPKTAGKAWVAGLDAADHADMRETAKMFLDETFLLKLNDASLKAEYSFPDYTVPLPELRENEDGNSLVRIDLQGAIPEKSDGVISLVWQDDEDEPLAMEVKTPAIRLLKIEPRSAPVDLMKIRADGTLEASGTSSLWTWIASGFRHILPLGIDHICFILGLFLLQPKWRPLLWQTSAFTLAHSITLALVVLGVFTIPSSVVEPMIALSIAYVGIENLWVKELKPWRVALVFALGLLHGMGFASVMQELEIPQGQVIEPLVGFNLGVELGQVTVLASAFALTFWCFNKPGFVVVRKIASALIGIVGLYWTYDRIWG